MACPEMGTIRAYVDGEVEGEPRVELEKHLSACELCRACAVGAAARAREIGDLLAVLSPQGQEVSPPSAALAAWRIRAAERRSTRRSWWPGGLTAMRERLLAPSGRWATAALAAVMVVAALLLSPVGPALGDLLSVFRAEKFAPVTIDPSAGGGVTAVSDPSAFGEFELRQEPTQTEVADLEAAGRQVDFSPRRPSWLPSGIGAEPRVAVTTPAEFVFVVDREKSVAALAEMGVTADLPAEMDGATVRVYIPANVQQMYATAEGQPALLIAQGRSPTLEMPAALDSPGLRDLFLSVAGLPPEMAEQLRAIADDRGTVPVPVRQGDTSREVEVDGGQGLLVTHQWGAESELDEASYVVWQKGGVVYLVAGAVPDEDLLAVARSLQP